MADQSSKSDKKKKTPLPAGFGLENEHPVLDLPFTLRVGDDVLEGKRLSVTQLEVAAIDKKPKVGGHQLATLKFPFEDFAITLMVDLKEGPRGESGEYVYLFAEPTGPHFAQLRYIMNSYIAGDIVTLKGMMAYTGPTQPKALNAEVKKTIAERVRSIVVATASLGIVFLAAYFLFGRYTTAYELHPVFVERSGLSMQATVAGQLTYIDTEAGVGEVAFSIASTTGDVLSFQKPTDGEVALSSEIYKGATVLPEDLIMTIFTDNSAVRLRTMISLEGLSRALQGDTVSIELNDGRKFPVEVLVKDITRAAALSGDLFVPVDLAVLGEALTPSDLDKSARLQLSKTLFSVFGLGQENGI